MKPNCFKSHEDLIDGITSAVEIWIASLEPQFPFQENKAMLKKLLAGDEMKISQEQMDRRLAMAEAKMSVAEAMSGHELTAMEWVNVLSEAMQRIIGHGLTEEWTDLDTPDQTNETR